MTSMTKHTLIDCFSLRARIGWQGLRSDEFKTEGPYLVTGVDFHNGRVNWDDCYHVTEERYAQDKGIQLHEHDLLITKDGTIGKTAVVIDCPEKATGYRETPQGHRTETDGTRLSAFREG